MSNSVSWHYCIAQTFWSITNSEACTLLTLLTCEHLGCLKWWNRACFPVPIPATSQSQPEPRPKTRPPLPKTSVERKLRSTDQKETHHYPNRARFQFMTFRVRVTAAKDSSLGKDLRGSWGCGDRWPALLWSQVCQTDQYHKIQQLFLSQTSRTSSMLSYRRVLLPQPFRVGSQALCLTPAKAPATPACSRGGWSSACSSPSGGRAGRWLWLVHGPQSSSAVSACGISPLSQQDSVGKAHHRIKLTKKCIAA